MAVVVFDPDHFREDFPQFADAAKFSDRRLQAAFEAACTLMDNTESSPVPYDPDKNIYIRQTILHYLTCHLLTLAGWEADGRSGPVTSVSQGSVSASFAVPQTTDKTYFLQTPCGQTYLAMLTPYRMGGMYVANRHCHPWG